MVSRSAYDQLNYSPLLLAGTVAGMLLTYVLPPLFAIFSTGVAQAIGALTWGLMSLAFLPTVRFYRLSPLWAAALPVIAAFYMVFTLDSAVQHWRGRGGLWKGRIQARRAEVS
jgi:type II secretory pathway component PulF